MSNNVQMPLPGITGGVSGLATAPSTPPGQTSGVVRVSNAPFVANAPSVSNGSVGYPAPQPGLPYYDEPFAPEPTTFTNVAKRVGLASVLIAITLPAVYGAISLIHALFGASYWMAAFAVTGGVVAALTAYDVADKFFDRRYMRYVRAMRILAGGGQP